MEALGALALFAFGTWAFWLLFGVASILLIAALEYERGGLATLTILTALGILYFFGEGSNLLRVIVDHWTWIVGYFLAGVFYSYGKWALFSHNAKEVVQDLRARFLREIHDLPDGEVPANLKYEWMQYLRQSSIDPLKMIPQARDHKRRIVRWMTYWLWSLVWTLLDDIVKKIFRLIYEKLQAAYQATTDWLWADLNRDLLTKKEEEAELQRRREEKEREMENLRNAAAEKMDAYGGGRRR